MIPIQLTENHFINPEAIAHVWCNPKTAGDRPAVCIVFTYRDRDPLELFDAEAEDAMTNWRKFQAASFPATD